MKPDLRTRAGRRQEIIDQVREHGGFSVFWATENHLRAWVATEMIKSGELADDKPSRYPWHSLKFAGIKSQSLCEIIDENAKIALEIEPNDNSISDTIKKICR